MIILQFAFDFAFLIVAGITTWFVARQLVIDSAMLMFTIVLSSLIAMVTFEPIAGLCQKHLFLEADYAVSCFLWPFFLLFIFGLTCLILYQSFSGAIGRTPELGPFAEKYGCWLIGGITGYFLAAFLLTVVHTIPGPRNFGGALYPEARRRPGPVMAMGPDYQYIALVEYTCQTRPSLIAAPLALGRPVTSAAIGLGRWPSFLIRYAIWREDLSTEEEDEEEESPQSDSE